MCFIVEAQNIDQSFRNLGERSKLSVRTTKSSAVKEANRGYLHLQLKYISVQLNRCPLLFAFINFQSSHSPTNVVLLFKTLNQQTNEKVIYRHYYHRIIGGLQKRKKYRTAV